MTSTLDIRLARLEAAQAPPVEVETSFAPGLRLLRLLLAVHLGDLRPGEDVVAGEARALGYGYAAEMRAAMVAEATTFIGWGTAHNVATSEMLAQRGGGSGAGIETNLMALDALLAEISAAFAEHPNADPEALPIAAEWVSL